MEKQKMKKVFNNIKRLMKDIIYSFSVVYTVILICFLIEFFVDPIWKS